MQRVRQVMDTLVGLVGGRHGDEFVVLVRLLFHAASATKAI